MISLEDFSQFINHEVKVLIEYKVLDFLENPIEILTLDKTDNVVQKINSMYKPIRWKLPTNRYTADFKDNRLNVNVIKKDDLFIIDSFSWG